MASLMTPHSAQGRIRAMMARPENEAKLVLLHTVAAYIFGTNFIGSKDGEGITLEAFDSLQKELNALKRQLPFLKMDVKAGASADMKASSHYEDVYDQLCELCTPHVVELANGCTTISKDSLCGSVVDNLSALIDYWLATKDETKFELGDHMIVGVHSEKE
jgi:hypothetical protein